MPSFAADRPGSNARQTMIGARIRGSEGTKQGVQGLSGAGHRPVPVHTPLFVGVTLAALLVISGIGALMLGEQLFAVAAAGLGVGLISGVVLARILAFE